MAIAARAATPMMIRSVRSVKTPGAGCPKKSPPSTARDRGPGFVQQLQDPRLIAQRLFGLSPLGDVARDLGDPHDLPGRILDGGDGQRDIKGGSVLAHADGFVMLDALPALQARQDAWF